MLTRHAILLDFDFQQLFVVSPTPFLVLAPDAPRFTIADVNDAYLAATMTTRDGLIGRAMFEAFPDNPDDAGADGVSNLRASLERALATRGPDAMAVQKYDIARRDGTFEQRWWSPVNTPVLDEEGGVKVIIHSVIDVTKEHRAEAALRANEARLRGVLDGMAEGFSLLAPDFTILEQNKEALRLDGRPREAIVGRPQWEAFPGSEHSELGRFYSRAMAERTPVALEHRCTFESGAVRWLDTRAYPTADGGLAVFWRDVTDRKEAEERARESEARHRETLQISTVGVVYFDMVGGITDANDAFLAFIGYGRDELLAGEVRYESLTPPDWAWRDERTIAELRTAGRSGPFEKEYFRRDGSRMTILCASKMLDARTAVEFIVDVSGRKAAEQALYETSERLALAIDNAEIGVWDVDLVSDVLVWPPRTRAMFGVSADAPATFQDAIDALYPEDREATMAAFAAAADPARRALYEVEYRTVGKEDGVVRWVAARARGVFDSAGRCLRITGTTIDITRRKRSEARERLRLALAEALRPLLDPREIMAAAAELVGRHLAVSRAGYGEVHDDGATINYETCYVDGAAPLVGTFPTDRFGPGNLRDLRRGLTTAYADLEADPRTAGAGFAAIEARAGMAVPLVRDGRLKAVFYLNHRETREWPPDEVEAVEDVAARTWDALERARAEAALRASEAALRRLNETLEAQVEERTADRDRLWRISQELLMIARFDGTVVAVNPAWAHSLGWSEAELVGITFWTLIHPDDLPACRAEAVALMTEVETARFECRCRANDGEWHWLSWSFASGAGLFHGVARDVTREKERQAAFELAQEELRQAQKMEAVGQLTGGVAHDFNNLLTIIKSSTDLLRRPGITDERKHRYVDAISDTVDRAAKLTGQLLAFARRQALKPEVFDVVERIGAIAEMLNTIVGSRIRIVIERSPEPCCVKADASQFETALVNMAVNARDAMEGEGTLTVRVALVSCLPIVRDEVSSRGSYVAVSVSDTGVGIPPDKLTQIFEPFFTTKEIGKGTGLGLSQVHGFAKQSSGDIGVESRVGQGTTFALYLPEAERLPVAAGLLAAERSEPAGEGQGRRVLVVEDNVEVGTFSTQLLQDLGYETTWAATADEALRLLEEVDRYDVVFSDVVMPGMSGVELGQEIRHKHPDLPIVLTSGYSHVLAEEGRHGFELLHKPYAAEDLSRVLHRLTKSRRAISLTPGENA